MSASRMTHPSLLTVLQNIVIVAVVALLAFLTEDPVVLLGLLLLAPVPVLQIEHYGAAAAAHGDEDDERNRDPEIGFTAKLRAVT